MDSLYFCPISARLSNSSFELFTPNDTPIQRFEAHRDGLRVALEAAKLNASSEIDTASDACFAAFSLSEESTALVSRIAFEGEDLERITDELLLAAGRPDVSGILRSMITPQGHVVVVVDYLPIAQRSESAEHAEALVEDLEAMHAAGLLHGGLNERFVNPEHPAGRRIFGVGLSETYAAWRRSQKLAIGELRADPRFASPNELRGAPASHAGDNFALAAVVLCEAQSSGDAIPALEPVQGINALLAKSRQRDTLVEYAKSIDDKRVREYLVAMMGPKRVSDPKAWRIAMLVMSGFTALMLLWLIIPSGKTSESSAPQTVAMVQGVECVGAAVSIIDG